METLIWRNGKLLDAEKTSHAVSLLDHGYLYGNGLFETMRGTTAGIRFLEQHLRRITRGMNILGWPVQPTMSELRCAVETAWAHCDSADAVVRLTISAGPGELRPDVSSCGQPMITVFVTPRVPREGSEAHWRLAVVPGRRNPLAMVTTIKSANYLENVVARRLAREQGADEALFLNVAGLVAEGAMSNLFLLQKDELITPDVPSGLLPGIMRAQVLSAARRQGVTITERPVELGELYHAQAIFMTNAIIGLMPVSSLDGVPIGQNRERIEELCRWVEGADA